MKLFLPKPLQFSIIRSIFLQTFCLMKFITTNARLLLCGVIIAAFFIPAYNNISGFGFINHAFLEVNTQNEITETDVLITITPLLFIPFSALFLLVRTAAHVSSRKMYLALPVIFMLFFFGIIFLTSRNSTGGFSSPTVFFQMQPGFYITVLASVLLIYTKNRRKRRRRRSVQSTETAAAA